MGLSSAMTNPVGNALKNGYDLHRGPKRRERTALTKALMENVMNAGFSTHQNMIDEAKRHARRLVKEGRGTHQECLDIIARDAGYKHWGDFQSDPINIRANANVSLTITGKQIVKAKETVRYSLIGDVLHEHDDCIRIAYEWLDAQGIRQTPSGRTWPLKHLIENWAGRYVSQTDVDVAAHMHPSIQGRYPDFNLSTRLVMPHERRLIGIGEVGKHEGKRLRHDPEKYAVKEK